MTPARLSGLFALGLVARLPGLLFSGTRDVERILAVWGAQVSSYGLATAFKTEYGVLSYALFGWLYELGLQIPRFYWAPYKATEITFEVLILAALYALAPVNHKWAPLVLYWLNPLFVFHGAYQGFWEGPHILMGLVAVLSLTVLSDERLGWATAGMLLMGSAMFKPQGLAYFVIPVCIYLGLQLLRGRSAPFLAYAVGVAAALAAGSASMVALGGRKAALLVNYVSAVNFMPNLCNGCVNIWRTIVVALQHQLDQSGPTYLVTVPAWLDRSLHAMAAIGTLTLIVLLAIRLPLEPTHPPLRKPMSLATRALAALQILMARVLGAVLQTPARSEVLLVVLAFASLVIAQVGTRAHINHTYSALVLLIPFVISRTKWLGAWLGMVAIQFYAEVVTYRLGEGIRPEVFVDPEAARALLDNLAVALMVSPYPHLVLFQQWANDMISRYLPGEPVIAGLAFVDFICAAYLILALLREPHVAPAHMTRPLEHPIDKPVSPTSPSPKIAEN